MTIKELVQKRYEQEIKSLSSQTKIVISNNFSDFSRLMVFHDHGPHVFNSFTTSERVKQELFDFSKRIWLIYVKEQIKEWKSIAIQNSSSPLSIVEKVFDEYLQKSYLLVLQTEERIVQKTIKNNCPHYTQALCFIKKEKSINDFLRCSERERLKLALFFNKFGEIYNDIISFYNQNKKGAENISDSSMLSEIVINKSITKPNKFKTKKAKTKTIVVQKPKPQKSESSSKNKHIKNKPDRLLEDIKEDIKDDYSRIQNQIRLFVQNYYLKDYKSPSVYDAPHLYFDDLTMMASINYGCNGFVSFGLSSNYFAPSFPVLFNFERDINIYDPDAIYHKPIVSDKVTRSAHRYKWFGANGMDCMTSLKKYGIAAKCINLYFGEYRCYIPVEIEDYGEECLAEIEITDDIVISTLTKRKDLIKFLECKDLSLRDFKLLEITDKLLYLCDYYDIYDFLGLDDDLYEKSEIIVQLQAEMSKKTIDEYLWDSYTLEEKNDFLMQRVKALRNKEAFLRFNIVKIHYLSYSKEMEVSYLIHSEYSIEVFVNIDITYNDGSLISYSHIKVDSYDDQFVYFQGKTRIKSEKDYLNIQLISLTCSDE